MKMKQSCRRMRRINPSMGVLIGLVCIPMGCDFESSRQSETIVSTTSRVQASINWGTRSAEEVNPIPSSSRYRQRIRNERLEDNDSEIRSEERRAARLRDEIQDLEQERNRVDAALGSVTVQLNTVERQLQERQGQAAELQKTIEKLEKEILHFRDELSLMKSELQRLQSLISESRNERVPNAAPCIPPHAQLRISCAPQTRRCR